MSAIMQKPATRGQMNAAMYYARKRHKARAEATIGKGGLRAQRPSLGFQMSVKLTTA